jgi:hypothetical protein
MNIKLNGTRRDVFDVNSRHALLEIKREYMKKIIPRSEYINIQLVDDLFCEVNEIGNVTAFRKASENEIKVINALHTLILEVV